MTNSMEHPGTVHNCFYNFGSITQVYSTSFHINPFKLLTVLANVQN